MKTIKFSFREHFEKRIYLPKTETLFFSFFSLSPLLAYLFTTFLLPPFLSFLLYLFCLSLLTHSSKPKFIVFYDHLMYWFTYPIIHSFSFFSSLLVWRAGQVQVSRTLWWAPQLQQVSHTTLSSFLNSFLPSFCLLFIFILILNFPHLLLLSSLPLLSFFLLPSCHRRACYLIVYCSILFYFICFILLCHTNFFLSFSYFVLFIMLNAIHSIFYPHIVFSHGYHWSFYYKSFFFPFTLLSLFLCLFLFPSLFL